MLQRGDLAEIMCLGIAVNLYLLAFASILELRLSLGTGGMKDFCGMVGRSTTRRQHPLPSRDLQKQHHLGLQKSSGIYGVFL